MSHTDFLTDQKNAERKHQPLSLKIKILRKLDECTSLENIQCKVLQQSLKLFLALYAKL